MKSIVLTGPTSMLGIALINKCIKEGTRVLAIANPGSSKIGAIPTDSDGLVKVVECSLQELHQLDSDGFPSRSFVSGSFVSDGSHSDGFSSDEFTLKEFLSEEPDCFYHLGWAATTHEGRMNVYPHIDNITYTIDAVELASRLGCRKFIGAGSQAEYGRVDCPLKGNTPTNPEVPYGVAKLAAGGMSRIRCGQLGLEHNWVRILSAYGPYDGRQTLISSLIESLRNGKHFATTEGEQIWDFINASDVAEALYLIGEKGINGKIYPIGSGVGKPLREFIECVYETAKRVGFGEASKSSLGFGEIPYGSLQVMHLVADISELTEDTGFVPKVSFEEGIEGLLR